MIIMYDQIIHNLIVAQFRVEFSKNKIFTISTELATFNLNQMNNDS